MDELKQSVMEEIQDFMALSEVTGVEKKEIATFIVRSWLLVLQELEDNERTTITTYINDKTKNVT